MAISFTVIGQPQTAGSKRAFPFKKQNGALGVRVTDDNSKSLGWKQAVAATAHVHYRGPLLDGPLSLRLVFFRPRPKGHFNGKGGLNKKGRGETHPTTKPDVLKLTRAVEDALTGVLWRDDAQIVDEHIAKQFGEPARVEIHVDVMRRESQREML